MKILMSRSRLERLCAGLSPVERNALAATVRLYPEPMPRGWPLHEVDQQRVGAAFERLRAQTQWLDHLGQAAGPGIYWHRPRGNGKRTPPPPWTPIAAGVWFAPPGTPAPATFDPAEFDLTHDEPSARRYWLNSLVTEPAQTDPVAQLLDVYRRISATVPRHLHAGENAFTAITGAYGGHKDGRSAAASCLSGTAYLGGMPIVLDPALPTNTWQIIDPGTGEVLHQGSVDDAPGREGRVVRDTRTGPDAAF